MELLWEISGWAGAVAILGAFMGMSMGWLKAGRAFQTANLAGACAFIVNGAFHGAWPSVMTNVAWFVISAVALLRLRTCQEPRVDDTEISPGLLLGVPDTTGQIAVVEPQRAVRPT